VRLYRIDTLVLFLLIEQQRWISSHQWIIVIYICSFISKLFANLLTFACIRIKLNVLNLHLANINNIHFNNTDDIYVDHMDIHIIYVPVHNSGISQYEHKCIFSNYCQYFEYFCVLFGILFNSITANNIIIYSGNKFRDFRL